MDYKGEWGGGGPGHSWALKWHERYIKYSTHVDPSRDEIRKQGPGKGETLPFTYRVYLDNKATFPCVCQVSTSLSCHFHSYSAHSIGN
jgi:hypothetical protein